MAAHLEEQQDLENFKHFWKRWGRWIFALLVAVAIGYFGWTLYQSHQQEKNQEAAAILAQLVEKANNKQDVKLINADLQNLQQNYANSIAAAQASMMVAATEFDAGNYKVAEGHLNWVLKQQQNPLVQALAIQRLATVQLQQKQYDAALATLQKPVDVAFESIVLETRGDVLAAQGKTKEALAAYDETLKKLPEGDSARELVQLKAEQLR